MSKDKNGDKFGFGNALIHLVHEFTNGLRGTGRTKHLVNIVEPGDCVVFATLKQYEQFMDRCYVEGVHGIVVSSLDHIQRKTRGMEINRLIIDHVFVEKLYLDALYNTQRYIDEVESYYSRRGDKE